MNLFSDIKNKVICITGGYGYLGTAMCEILSVYGAIVYVAGRDHNKFKSKFNGTNIKFVELDVSSQESVELALAEIYKIEKKLDVLINNAHYGETAHPERLTLEQWKTGMDGGVNQYFNMIKATIPYLKRNKFSKIINVASMYGIEVPDLDIYDGREELLNPPNYGTSKAAIIHLSKYYAMYLAKYNINVNTISPGPFPSLEVQKDKAFINRLEKKTKLKRIGKPQDLKGVVLLLASNASDYITGQNIVVDGGWTI